MDLVDNPFLKLGATMRDDRHRIMELAEEKSLTYDESGIREATALLTNPRRRLAAEISWFPGLGPERISEVLWTLARDPTAVRELQALPSLVFANLLANGLVKVVEKLPLRDIALWVIELASEHDKIDAEKTIITLNEERSVAGFPAISDRLSVDAELKARRQYYRHAIKSALDKLPASSIVEVVTIAVDEATDNGKHQAPILIDDLIDSFELEAQEFLETETTNIYVLVELVRSTVECNDNQDVIDCHVIQLENVVKNWDRVAQPIQVSARSRGTSHKLSRDIATTIRNLSINLFNEHGLLELSKRLTTLQQEVFAEIDQVAEQSEEDASALDEITEQRAQYYAEIEARTESWKKEITYEANVGGSSRDMLRISPNGVQWQGSQIALEEINRVRWGATKRSLVGIGTGSDFFVMVGNQDHCTTVRIRNHMVYSRFVDRLWKAVGGRLLHEMLEGLRDGRRYWFGKAVVMDSVVELERRRLFAENYRVPCEWSDVAIGNGTGTFYMAKKGQRSVAVELPFEDIDNVNILEVALRVFQTGHFSRLSDLLDRTS